MKAMVITWSGALILAACSAAKAEAPHLLSQLGGTEDNALITQVQARNPGSLCSLVTTDGFARLMSFGGQAVVDIHGKPIVLSYRPGPGKDEASFSGPGVQVSGALSRQQVTNLGKTASHDVTVDVQASGRTEHLLAAWTCQKALLSVDAVH